MKASPVQKDRCPSATYDWGIPASGGERLALDGRAGRPGCLCKAGRPVTGEPSRNMAAVLSAMPMQRTSRFSTQARDAWIASLVQEAGGLPAVLAVRHRMLRKRSVQTPARRTSTSVLMTVTQEPSRLMAAVLSAMPMQRTSRFSTQTRDAWIGSLEQEAGAACRIGWPRDATSTPFGLVGRDTARPTNGFSPKGPTPGCPMRGESVHGDDNLPPCSRRLGGRDVARPTNGFSPKGPTPGCPMRGQLVPGGSNTCHRMPVGWVAATKSRPNAQESRSKLGRIRIGSGSFSRKETP